MMAKILTPKERARMDTVCTLSLPADVVEEIERPWREALKDAVQLDPGQRVVLITFPDVRGKVKDCDGYGHVKVDLDDGTEGMFALVDLVCEECFDSAIKNVVDQSRAEIERQAWERVGLKPCPECSNEGGRVPGTVYRSGWIKCPTCAKFGGRGFVVREVGND